MADLRKEEIRAEINIGGHGIPTPYVLNFNVSRARQSPISTFSASVEISEDDLLYMSVGSSITISAGIYRLLRLPSDDSYKIFTGNVESVTVNPHWEKANVYIVNLQGSDALKDLEGKRFSRRQKCLGLGKLAVITGIVSKSHHKGWVKKDRVMSKPGNKRFITDSLDLGEVPELIRTRSINTSNPYKLYAKKPAARITSPETNRTIFPGSVLVSLGSTTEFECSDCTGSGDSIDWSVVNPNVGTITQDEHDSTKATYTQTASGYNRVVVSDDHGRYGYADVSGMQRHDHSSLGAGGAAYGVYRT
jgi:hypothetical protein